MEMGHDAKEKLYSFKGDVEYVVVCISTVSLREAQRFFETFAIPHFRC